MTGTRWTFSITSSTLGNSSSTFASKIILFSESTRSKVISFVVFNNSAFVFYIFLFGLVSDYYFVCQLLFRLENALVLACLYFMWDLSELRVFMNPKLAVIFFVLVLPDVGRVDQFERFLFDFELDRAIDYYLLIFTCLVSTRMGFFCLASPSLGW